MMKKLFTTREIVLVGIFTAFTAIMAQITIPLSFSPVPITMQVFAVCLAAAIQGSKCGTASQLVYVLLGAIGVPVFSGFGSGLGAILGPKGGYIISFPIAALVIGLIIERNKKVTFTGILLAMTAGLAVCYAIGVTWLGLSQRYSPTTAILAGAGWYLPLDAVKIGIAAMISFRVRSTLIKAGYIK